MAVVITKNPAFWAPGFLVIPDDDGTLTFEYRARFKRLKSERQRQILDLIEKNREADRNGQPLVLTDRELLNEVMVDWEGFNDEEGKAVMYTPVQRDQACADWLGLEASFCRAFLNAAWPAQRKKEAEKN